MHCVNYYIWGSSLIYIRNAIMLVISGFHNKLMFRAIIETTQSYFSSKW